MNKHSHILICGGGLAGLISAIHLTKAGISVTLIEKDTYPKHKVCGEYISNEILLYLKDLDLNIDTLNPSKINELHISTSQGKIIKSKLSLGGFGISRYTLDYYLWNKAKEQRVHLINEQVTDIKFNKKEDIFIVKTASGNNNYTSDYIIAAHGKRSILDKNLKRNFSTQKSPWLAVKAHYKTNLPSNNVALHNFKGGYCGISKVENDIVNACYLVHYDSFGKYKDIQTFQRKVMYQNPQLKMFFEKATLLFDKPIAISQVNFRKKQPVEHHVFMIGDAAGLIHPLCGNGMAMAIQSAQILSTLLIKSYKEKSLSRAALEKRYVEQWKSAFSRRLFMGRILQKILMDEKLQRLAHKLAIKIPFLVPKIIKQTHGKPLIC